MNRRAIAPRELLAIDPRAIQRDADGLFLLFGPEIPENECVAGVSVVHIRGPLDHHRGFGDSYDAIRERMQCAFEDDETSAVIARIDSPGGSVAGLLDTVRAIQEMAERSGKRSVAYVDESSFSAAYALSCAFDEIVLPPSAITGSIGVISTMADQVDADIMSGLNVVTLTSGARKADGHPHVRITDAMVSVEQKRVDKLAMQFFRMVSESRGIAVKTVAGFQAGLFLGEEAVKALVADRVETFDTLIGELSPKRLGGLAKSGTPDKPKSHGTTSEPSGDPNMNARGALLEELKAARSALASAKPAEKPAAQALVSGLQATLNAYKKVTEKHVEHQKTSEEAEDEEADGNETDRNDDPEDDEDEGEEKKEASSPKKAAKKMAEDESDAESESDEAEALAAQVRRATGRKGAAAQGALAALVAQAKAAPGLAQRLAQLEQERVQEKLAGIVQSALSANRITSKEAKVLQAKPMAYVQAFLEARPKSLVVTSEDALLTPAEMAGGHAQLPPDMRKMLDAASQATNGKVTAEQFVVNYAQANGLKTGSL